MKSAAWEQSWNEEVNVSLLLGDTLVFLFILIRIYEEYARSLAHLLKLVDWSPRMSGDLSEACEKPHNGRPASQLYDSHVKAPRGALLSCI
ncbi:hypothetical protein VTL71DRAFT_2073 [Oculimacula yallundae]|uniref:Uncharacterized protein n=1 Tax=Oculimacula yallundae TaxID=86028 RepID=A0ABR4C903_9HELO